MQVGCGFVRFIRICALFVTWWVTDVRTASVQCLESMDLFGISGLLMGNFDARQDLSLSTHIFLDDHRNFV